MKPESKLAQSQLKHVPGLNKLKKRRALFYIFFVLGYGRKFKD